MKKTIGLFCLLALAVLVVSSCRTGAGGPTRGGIPVDNRTECSRIPIQPLGPGSKAPFNYCTDMDGSKEGAIIDHVCAGQSSATCAAGKCDEQGRGKCIAKNGASVGVVVNADCRRDDTCTEAGKNIRCVGDVTVPAGGKLQCTCDCTSGFTRRESAPGFAERAPNALATLRLN